MKQIIPRTTTGISRITKPIIGFVIILSAFSMSVNIAKMLRLVLFTACIMAAGHTEPDLTVIYVSAVPKQIQLIHIIKIPR